MIVAVASSSPSHGSGSTPNFIEDGVGLGADDQLVLALDVGHRVGELGVDEQDPGAGVGDDVLHLLGDESEVDRHEDAARPDTPNSAVSSRASCG